MEINYVQVMICFNFHCFSYLNKSISHKWVIRRGKFKIWRKLNKHMHTFFILIWIWPSRLIFKLIKENKFSLLFKLLKYFLIFIRYNSKNIKMACNLIFPLSVIANKHNISFHIFLFPFYMGNVCLLFSIWYYFIILLAVYHIIHWFFFFWMIFVFDSKWDNKKFIVNENSIIIQW